MSAGGFWNSARGYTRMALEDILLNLDVGICAWERDPDQRQRVLVSIECFMLQARHTGETVDSVLDYARLYEAAMAWERAGHIDLLETIAEGLAEDCFADPRVEACRIHIRKPDIFHNARSAGVEFYRVRSER